MSRAIIFFLKKVSQGVGLATRLVWVFCLRVWGAPSKHKLLRSCSAVHWLIDWLIDWIRTKPSLMYVFIFQQVWASAPPSKLLFNYIAQVYFSTSGYAFSELVPFLLLVPYSFHNEAQLFMSLQSTARSDGNFSDCCYMTMFTPRPNFFRSLFCFTKLPIED